MIHRNTIRMLGSAGGFLLAGALWWGPGTRRTELLPASDSAVYAYSDADAGGSSRLEGWRRTPEGLGLAYRLGASGTGWVGLGVRLGARDSGVDLSEVGSIRVRLRHSGVRATKVMLVADDPSIRRPSDPLSRRYCEQRIDPARELDRDLSLSAIALAPWWVDRGYAPPEDTARRLDRVIAVEVQVVAGGRRGGSDTLVVRSLQTLSPVRVWRVAALLLSLAALGAGLSVLRRRRPDAPVPADSPESLAAPPGVPEPVPVALRSESDEQRERLVAFLRERYHEPDLDAERVEKETGIARDRLAGLLREAYGTPFKPFLNELRLAEARRLLTETDRTVSEIAFAVGYNSATHFARVFRERFQAPPTEWREANRPGAAAGS